MIDDSSGLFLFLNKNKKIVLVSYELIYQNYVRQGWKMVSNLLRGQKTRSAEAAVAAENQSYADAASACERQLITTRRHRRTLCLPVLLLIISNFQRHHHSGDFRIPLLPSEWNK
uniref:Uncharacterized protein n=1 Tax=Opuntia streptacantha TaxID=393608 RepID=A0A7C9ATN8_OPUST